MGLLFSWLDYSIFSLMLVLSIFIGVFFGFCAKRKQDNPAEYLHGSKQLKALPVAISLTATHVSAVTILGVPAEMYIHGTQYWASLISGIVVTLAMSWFYLPVFYELQDQSMYTYLERRFDHRQRTLASSLFCLASILYMPLIVYAPAIAFSQVTGVNLHVITPIMCIICIFYTTFGGIRAVVWTDTLQFVAMVLSIVAVIILGTITVGGLSNVYEFNDQGGRIIWFNMDPDPTSRSTFLSVTVGLTAMWISIIGVTPECIQRFLSVSTYKEAKQCLWIFGFGHTAVKLFAVFCGVIIYARYHTCDPYTIGEIKKFDQIFPYYVMDIAQSIPGLPGLFVAGVFSAALSSMSSSLNVLSGTIYSDFLKRKFPKTSEKCASTIMKSLVVGIGCFAIVMVLVVERLGNIFGLAISIVGVTSGPLLGMFTLGMAFPKANRHGAFWGSVVSLVIVIILSLGANLAILDKSLKYESLPLRTDGCDALGFTSYLNTTKFLGNRNSTVYIINENADNSEVPWFFRFGFMYYSLLGTLLVFIVGYPVSLLTGGHGPLDERLLAPFFRRRYVESLRKSKEREAEMKPLNVCSVDSMDAKEKESQQNMDSKDDDIHV